MTIGIAASGPGAGRAILGALAKVELIATGAIGGFISFACISETGLLRASAQRGGARGLLAGGPPDGIDAVRLAVLMSSGPDRPEPLAQFTPGDAAAGLVTGHRFPNAAGGDGISLAQAALDRMRRGDCPQTAAGMVARANPGADAGLVCLGLDGRIGMANTAYVAGFPGLGEARHSDGGRHVGVLCNGISQAGPLAELVARMVLDAMQPARAATPITLRGGLRVGRAPTAELRLDAALVPQELRFPSFCGTDGDWTGGYGPDARVSINGTVVGRLLDEPFMTGRCNRAERFDGRNELVVRFAPLPCGLSG